MTEEPNAAGVIDNGRIPEPLRVLGVAVTPFLSNSHVIDCVARLIEEGEKAFCVAINPEKVQQAQRAPAFGALLDSADMRICDGIGTALAIRLLHKQRLPRVTGVSLFLDLLGAASQRGWPVFLLGASPEVNEAAVKILKEKHPDLSIAGRRDGYFSDSDEVVRQVNESGAQLLFVALGSPKQEQWISENLPRLEVHLCMGVGGSLDVVSGKVVWAPRIFRKTGTEWLYRLLSQPRRWRRQLVLPVFAWRVLLAWLGGGSSEK